MIKRINPEARLRSAVRSAIRTQLREAAEQEDVEEACGNVGLTNLGKRFCEDDLEEDAYAYRNHLDAQWQVSPLAATRPEDDEELPAEDPEQIEELRSLVQLVLREYSVAGPGVTADPTTATRPYDYDVPRGTDLYAYWYRSPGDKTTGGNYRPDNPADYIGMDAGDVAGEPPPEPVMAEEEDPPAEDALDEVDGEEIEERSPGYGRPCGC